MYTMFDRIYGFVVNDKVNFWHQASMESTGQLISWEYFFRGNIFTFEFSSIDLFRLNLYLLKPTDGVTKLRGRYVCDESTELHFLQVDYYFRIHNLELQCHNVGMRVTILR